MALFLEVPEHENLAVGLAQFHQALVQHSSQCFQQRGVLFHGRAKFDGRLLATLTAQCAAPPLAGLEQRGFLEPADQRCFAPQPERFAGERDEDILGDFLRCRRVPQPANNCGKHQIHVAFNELLERALRSALRVVAEQVPICHWLGHPT